VHGSFNNDPDGFHMPQRSYRVVLWTLALLGVSLDQASKYGVFAWLASSDRQSYSVFATADPNNPKRSQGFELVAEFQRNEDGTLKLAENGKPVPHVNQGALFGFLKDYTVAANSGFAVISLLAALAIAVWSMQPSTARDRWLCAALGLILAGTLGNLYDRIVFNGVRDFLHWNYRFDWPVFNLADCCLVVGAALLLIQAFNSAKVPLTVPEAASTEPVAATSGSVNN
jgi:signal peptidase II